MSIGASLFLIAAGAILRYAITWNPKDVNINTIGLILIIVGIVGLLLSLLWMFIYADRRRETTAHPPPPRDRDVY
jgi:beta-lactamase regulating signal transducer with metallopeptidase domain